MTQPEHPSVEQISDLLAGVMPAAEAMDVNAHLASCEACRDERSALLELSALLADEGAAPLEMPADVAASIDAAITLASTQRAAGVASIEPGRPSSDRAASGRQPWKWLVGAAAAVLVVGVGFAGLRALPSQQSSDNADSAAGAESGAESGYAGSPPKEQARTTPPSSIVQLPSASGGQRDLVVGSRDEAAAAGRLLLRSAADAKQPEQSGCAEPLTGGPSTVVRFEGHRAVLTVSRDTRVVTIYDCATATKALLVTGY